MTIRTPDRSRTARVAEITIADSPEAWTAAGFEVVGDAVDIGGTTFRLTGPDADRRGITGWTLDGIPDPGTGTIDGIPTTFLQTPAPDPAKAPHGPSGPRPVHPNGTIGLDHVVVTTPDLDRTIKAFATIQLPHRRIREVGSGPEALRQAFIRIGSVIVEVVGSAVGSGEPAEVAPAGWFGIAVDVDDLDRTAAVIGDGIGRIKPAVQEGRRIGTIRHRKFDISVAIAAMDHRAHEETQ